MIEIKNDKKLSKFPILVMESVKKSVVKTFSELGLYFTKKKVPETFRKRGKRGDNPEWRPLSIYTIAERLLRHGGKYTTKGMAKKLIEKEGGIPIQKLMAEKKSMPILVDTGELIRSFDVLQETVSFKENLLQIGSRLKHASKHQFGDKSNKYNNRSAPIPRRRMIFITRQDDKEITTIFNQNLRDIL